MTVVNGDLRTPQLGLDGATQDSLANTITEIEHCAADIRFTRLIEDARSGNTVGTRKILSLAREARGLKRFAHRGTTIGVCMVVISANIPNMAVSDESTSNAADFSLVRSMSKVFLV